jgi:hypothetical protein
MSAPPGVDGGSNLNDLFGGMGGSIVELSDGGHVVAPGRDAGEDAGEALDASMVGEDAAAADAGEDAAMGVINPQCQTCYASDSVFPTCPVGYGCFNRDGASYCLIDPDTSGMCPENLFPLGAHCVPTGITCPTWAEMFGNQ